MIHTAEYRTTVAMGQKTHQFILLHVLCDGAGSLRRRERHAGRLCVKPWSSSACALRRGSCCGKWSGHVWLVRRDCAAAAASNHDCDSFGRHEVAGNEARTQKHGQTVHELVVSSSWVGSDSCTFDSTLYACMFMCGLDAGVVMCGLSKCCLLQQSCAGMPSTQSVCWVAWKVRVVDRMPCTRVLMPYRANEKDALFDACSLLRILKLLTEIRHTHLVRPHAL